MRTPKFLFLIIFLTVIKIVNSTKVVDYFGSKYDESKNCIKSNLMQKLQKEKHPARCAIIADDGSPGVNNTISGVNNTISGLNCPGVKWEKCKKTLSRMLQLKCAGLGILKVKIEKLSSPRPSPKSQIQVKV